MLHITVTTACSEKLSSYDVNSLSAAWDYARFVRDNTPNVVGSHMIVTDETENVLLQIEFVQTKNGKIQFKNSTKKESAAQKLKDTAAKKKEKPVASEKKETVKKTKHVTKTISNSIGGKSELSYYEI